MGILDMFRRKTQKMPVGKVEKVVVAEAQKKNEIKTEKQKPNRIRLVYVAIGKYLSYDTSEIRTGETYNITSEFILPSGMSMKDACKVVSYLSEKVEREDNLDEASPSSVAKVSNILEQYGFKKVENCPHGRFHRTKDVHGNFLSSFSTFEDVDEQIKVDDVLAEKPGVVDLFTVGGDFRLFTRTPMDKRYFEWFTPRVKREEIEKIYANIGEDISEF